MDINVTVNNICLLNPDTLNSGEAYIHKLNFNFSEEYTSDLVYRACFTCLSGTYVSPILNNECEIPPEVLENEGIIELGVYAYILEDNTLIKRFSPEHIFIKIIAGSYREGLESEAPTPTEQEQWIDSFNRNYLNKIELFNENAATKTQEFTDVADKAASDINNVVEKLEEDVASHVYDGATFIPNVDTKGNISWTNNQDFPNPETRNIRGPQGPQGETGPVGPAGAVKTRMVDELPDVSEAEEGVLYFVPKEETETAEDLYEEYVFTDGRYEFIGSRHISIDLTDYVKFTDYGTGQKAGVIKTGNSLSINSSGQPQAVTRTYEEYINLANSIFIGKGTLENVITGKNLETANNKVTTIDENSTDTEYPSAKAVYNSIKDFSTEEELLSENPTENLEGTELEIDNTIDSRIKLNKLGGNTSQEGTPTPDIPVEVKVVTGENVVSAQGKNLLDMSYLVKANADDKTYAGQGFWAFKLSDKIGTYTLSRANADMVAGGSYIAWGEGNDITTAYNRKTWLAHQSSAILNNKSQTKTNSGELWLFLSTNETRIQNIPNDYGYLMLEEGSTASEYTPFSKTDYPLSLGTLELCKIGDYQDYLYKNNGKWYVHKEIRKYELDENTHFTQNWNTNTDYETYCMLCTLKTNFGSNAIAISNILPYVSSVYGYDKIGIFQEKNSGGRIIFRVPKTIANSVSEFQTWLASNSMIVYTLIAPTETEITDTALLSQLEDFYNAKTLQEKTIILQENEELPFILNLDYFTNSIAGNIAGTNYNVDTLIADIEKALEEINGESVGG